jgi:hypothetical protein
MTFVRTSCEKFDDFNNTCLKMKDTNIGPWKKRLKRCKCLWVEH